MLAPDTTAVRAPRQPPFPTPPPTPPQVAEVAVERTSRLPILLAALLLSAAGLWALALQQIDPAQLDDPGLPRALPAAYFASLICLCLSFMLSVRAASNRWAMTSLIGLAVAFYATAPVLYDVPRYAFTYKHIAVMHYIELHGAVDRSVDIYHNWPGFFSANAMLAQVTGVDPLVYANWSMVLFPVLNLLALRFVFSSLTSSKQRVNIAVAIFLVAEWVEQGYLAPQSFAYFLTFVIIGLALRWLRPDGTEWHDRLLVRINQFFRQLADRLPLRQRRRPAVPETSAIAVIPAAHPTAARVLTLVLIMGLCLAIITSHQLTPFFLVLYLSVLVVARRIRTWWLPILIGVVTLLWIFLARDYLASHGLAIMGGNPLQNAKPANHPAPAAGSVWKETVAWTARSLTLLVLAASAVGSLRDRKVGRGQAVAVMFACVSPMLAVVQSYGGEGVYRIYMFLVPWAAYLAAGMFVGSRRNPSLRRAWILFFGLTAASFAFTVAYFGLDAENRMTKPEVASTLWYEQNSPDDAQVMALVGNHPMPISGNYDRHMRGTERYDLDIFTAAAYYDPKEPFKLDVDHIWEMAINTGRPSYLFLSPSQMTFAANHGYATTAQLQKVQDELVHSDRFKVVFADQGTYVLTPQLPSRAAGGTGAAGANGAAGAKK